MSSYVPTTMHRDLEVESFVTVHYLEHAKNYAFEGEQHDFWELVYVDKGRLEVVADDQRLELQQGQVIFHQPNEFHNLCANGTIAPNIVVISFVCHSPAMDFFKRKITCVNARQRDLLARIIEESHQAFTTPLGDPYTVQLTPADTAPFASEQLLSLYLEALLIDMVRNNAAESAKPSSSIKTRSDNELVERIIRYMEIHLSDRLSFSAICHYSSQSATNLKTIFKSVTGQGVMEYYRNLKIQQAKVLLRESDGNISQIADALGYNSVQYFSRHFKQATGMTPREYTLSVQAN